MGSCFQGTPKNEGEQMLEVQINTYFCPRARIGRCQLYNWRQVVKLAERLWHNVWNGHSGKHLLPILYIAEHPDMPWFNRLPYGVMHKHTWISACQAQPSPIPFLIQISAFLSKRIASLPLCSPVKNRGQREASPDTKSKWLCFSYFSLLQQFQHPIFHDTGGGGWKG